MINSGQLSAVSFQLLKDTDGEADRWYEYELIGARIVDLRLVRDPGSGVVFVRVRADEELEEKAAVVAEIMGSYRLSEGPKGVVRFRDPVKSSSTGTLPLTART